MMHGMTGTAEMMRPFAEKILPEGWTLLVPDARFDHPRRGKTWWRYEDEDPDVTRRLQLSRRELMDVDSSLSQLEKLIAEEAPMGPLVVGGFSQGGAMAQEMLQLPLADRIVGIVALGTRLVRPMELRLRLEELDKKGCFGCMACAMCGCLSKMVGPLLICSKQLVGALNWLNIKRGT